MKIEGTDPEVFPMNISQTQEEGEQEEQQGPHRKRLEMFDRKSACVWVKHPSSFYTSSLLSVYNKEKEIK